MKGDPPYRRPLKVAKLIRKAVLAYQWDKYSSDVQPLLYIRDSMGYHEPVLAVETDGEGDVILTVAGVFEP